MSLPGKLHRSLIYGRRVRRLSELLSQLLPQADSVLDVGCGDGRLAWSLQKARPELRIEGVDVLMRERTWIHVRSFDGRTLPYADSSFDAVILVDVLHHTLDPLALLRESLRVSRRWLIIKDHILQGLAAGMRLRFMDYAGNSDHRVALPYNYMTEKQWEEFEQMLNVRLISKRRSLGLYRWPLDYIFGAGLHFIAVYETGRGDDTQKPILS
jgi:SAM-dependent methyltransferase